MAKSTNIKKNIADLLEKGKRCRGEFRLYDTTIKQESFTKTKEGKVTISSSGVTHILFGKSNLEKLISIDYTLEDFIVWYSTMHDCIKYEFKKNDYEIPLLANFSEMEKYFYGLKVESIDFRKACVQSRGSSSFIFIELDRYCMMIHSWENDAMCKGLNPTSFQTCQI